MSGPPPPPPPVCTERATLSRELADFLIELSIALHKHAMYPEGHPSLDPAAVGVTRRAEHLFEGRATLALGVARQARSCSGGPRPSGWPVRAVERLVEENSIARLVDVLDAHPPVRADMAPLWTRVTSPDVVRQLASSEPPDFSTIDRVLPRLPVDAFQPLLDVLSASESRTTRRGLLDRLFRAPRELGVVISARLSGDVPWYVVRNLLLILDGLPGLPEGFSTAAFMAHPDVRVRREAVKLALKIPAEREAALLGALRDPDPRMARLGLTAALEQCPPGAVPLVTEIAPELRDRLRAARAGDQGAGTCRDGRGAVARSSRRADGAGRRLA